MFNVPVMPAKPTFSSVEKGAAVISVDWFNPKLNREYKAFLNARYPDDEEAKTEWLKCTYCGLTSFKEGTNHLNSIPYGESKWHSIPAVPVGPETMVSIDLFSLMAIGKPATRKLEEQARNHIISGACWNAYAKIDTAMCIPGTGCLVTCEQLSLLMESPVLAGHDCQEPLRIAQTKMGSIGSDRPGGQAFVVASVAVDAKISIPSSSTPKWDT